MVVPLHAVWFLLLIEIKSTQSRGPCLPRQGGDVTGVKSRRHRVVTYAAKRKVANIFWILFSVKGVLRVQGKVSY